MGHVHRLQVESECLTTPKRGQIALCVLATDLSRETWVHFIGWSVAGVTKCRVTPTDLAPHIQTQGFHATTAAAYGGSSQNDTNGHGTDQGQHDKECKDHGRHNVRLPKLGNCRLVKTEAMLAILAVFASSCSEKNDWAMASVRALS